MYNGILLSHKKEQNNDICSNMDGPRDCLVLSEASQKDKCHIISFICEIKKKKKVQMNWLTKQK